MRSEIAGFTAIGKILFQSLLRKTCFPVFEVYLLRVAQFGQHHLIHRKILHRYAVPNFLLEQPVSRNRVGPSVRKSGGAFSKMLHILSRRAKVEF